MAPDNTFYLGYKAARRGVSYSGQALINRDYRNVAHTSVEQKPHSDKTTSRLGGNYGKEDQSGREDLFLPQAC